MRRRSLRKLSLILGLLFFCCSLGCSWRPVKNVYYTPQPGLLEIAEAPCVPLAVVDSFLDERCGKNRDPFLCEMMLALPLMPYCSYEFPQFYREEPKEGLDQDDPDCPAWPTLREQYRRMVRRHLTGRKLFRFVENDSCFAASDALFRISGTIHRTTCRGHLSSLGLGLFSNLLGPPFFYADGFYLIDVTLECSDVSGHQVATHRVFGRTRRWFDADPEAVREPYARLRPISKFLEPEIEAFARKIHDALAEKDAAYWDELAAARRDLQLPQR